MTLKVESMCKSWEMRFVEELDLMGYRFGRAGKGVQVNTEDGKLVERCAQISREESVAEGQMWQGGKPCLQHCFEWKCDWALECGKSDVSQTMGI